MIRREPYNVADAMQLDALLRRKKAIRAELVQSRIDIEWWNRAHPNDPPFDTTFEDAMIVWLDSGGVGPMPLPPKESLDGIEP